MRSWSKFCSRCSPKRSSARSSFWLLACAFANDYRTCSNLLCRSVYHPWSQGCISFVDGPVVTLSLVTEVSVCWRMYESFAARYQAVAMRNLLILPVATVPHHGILLSFSSSLAFLEANRRPRVRVACRCDRVLIGCCSSVVGGWRCGVVRVLPRLWHDRALRGRD